MATKTIAQLPAAASVVAGTLFDADNGGQEQKVTGQQIIDFINQIALLTPLVEDYTGNEARSWIMKVNQPLEPDSWEFYISEPGVEHNGNGNPDTNPIGWTLHSTLHGVSAAVMWEGFDSGITSGFWVICRYKIGAKYSQWSNVVLMS